jgi:hypothetical protein
MSDRQALVDALRESSEAHMLDRWLGPAMAPTGWRCRCGFEFEHPSEVERNWARILHKSAAQSAVIDAYRERQS